MTLPLPEKFEFTVLPKHVVAEHRCDSRRCVMAQACFEALPEGYTYVPAFDYKDMRFEQRDSYPGDRDARGGTWLDETPSIATDTTVQAIVSTFDNGEDDRLLALIGDGLTFVVDTERMIVRLKEQ